MKYFLLALVVALQQLPPEPYPGQREHMKPPPGWYCSHDSKDPAKVCACKRVDSSHDCDGIPTEDMKCKVYCHKQHCHCPIVCEVDHKPEQPTEPEQPHH